MRLRIRDSFRTWPRRSSGNGGKPSQPQPRRTLGGTSSDGKPRAEADGRAADEAAAMRTRTGLPFSGCDGGRLREAPIRNLKRPSGTTGTGTGPKVFGPAERTGRTPDLRIQDQPGRRRCLRTGALPPAQKELRLRRGRAGPGFGPGAANQTGPRASAHGPSGGTKASAEDPAGGDVGISVHDDAKGQEEEREFRIRRAANRQGFGPDGEPSGTPEGLRPGGTPEEAGPGPVLVTAPRNRPSRKAASANRTRRDSGARQQCRAPLLSGDWPVGCAIPSLRGPRRKPGAVAIQPVPARHWIASLRSQ